MVLSSERILVRGSPSQESFRIVGATQNKNAIAGTTHFDAIAGTPHIHVIAGTTHFDAIVGAQLLLALSNAYDRWWQLLRPYATSANRCSIVVAHGVATARRRIQWPIMVAHWRRPHALLPPRLRI